VRLGELPQEVSATALYTQMGKLGTAKKEHEEKILGLKNEELQKQLPVDLLTYENFLEVLKKLKETGLSVSKKQKIIVSLIERIEVFPERLDIHFAVGSEKIKRELALANSLFISSKNLLVECSTSLTNGGAVATTSAPSKTITYLHDFILYLPKTKENIFLVCSPLYVQGLSLSEIERQTGFSRNTIRDIFTSEGLPLRSSKPGTASPLKNPEGMRGGTLPYGYTYLKGKVVPAPKEYKIVIKIYRLWKGNQTFRAIARQLDDLKIPTRTGRKWTHELIKKIIERHEADLKKDQ
jgi:hypothetical protein